MNTLLKLLPPGVTITSEQPGAKAACLVLVAPHAASQTMITLAAHLAFRGPLRVLDGGNRFNAFLAARCLRSIGAPELEQTLENIRVARAFTCYQMTVMLEQTPPHPLPTLIIDLLDTFYDESAPLPERRRLARRCAQRLQILGKHAPVVVSLRPPPPNQPDPTGLQAIIQKAADLLWQQDVPQPPKPLTLF
jgi:hypothetical protein